MKKLIRLCCLLLAAAALLGACCGVLAADAVVSNQKLKIDGVEMPTVAYNIDGSNYFRLRDIAYLLNGTEARFSVGYDKATNSVTIVTGESYAMIGTELLPLEGGPKDVRESPQTIYINGKKAGRLSVYNIDGYNYFMLRDLGDALGFEVDYDTENRTMLVTTPQTKPLPVAWEPDIAFTTVDMDGNPWTDACFADHALTVVNLWAWWCGPCVSEMPDLQQLSQDYADRGVQFLGIYDPWDEADNREVAADLGITYPCLRYTEDFDPYMNTGYIPVTVFVDGSGKVLGEAFIGSRSYESWAAVIEECLG